MTDLLGDLYNYIAEHTPSLRNDPEYERALQAYTKIEEKVKEKIGEELLYEYQCAEADIFHRQNIAVFAQTLRSNYHFLLEILRG